jgi:capsule biosynthesis phosphatase
MSEKKRVCFDVDGTVCDDSDQSVPYADRKPYPRAVEAIRKLAEAGHTIIFSTARYMNRFDGDQQKATEYGRLELVRWLNEHGIPHHEVYMGKASAHIYADDRAFLINSTGDGLCWRLLEGVVGVASSPCQCTTSPASADTASPAPTR